MDKGGGQGANVTIAPGIYAGPVSIGGTGTSLLGDGSPGDIVIHSGISIGASTNTVLHNLTLDGDGGNVVALNDARDVLISECVLTNGAAGLALNNSTGIQLSGNITIDANTGIGLSALSTLLYNADAPQAMSITGPGNGTGIGIQIDSGGVGITGDVEIEGYLVGILAENGATLNLGSQQGSRIHDNTFGALLRGAAVRLGGTMVDQNTAHGIVAINGSTVTLSGTHVKENGINDVRARDNSSVRLFISTIEDNLGNGVELSTLASLRLEGFPFPESVITGNSLADIVCENTSKVDGATGAAVVLGCDEPDLAALQAELDELRDLLESHTHTYLTGDGNGHNNTEAETGPPLP